MIELLLMAILAIEITRLVLSILDSRRVDRINILDENQELPGPVGGWAKIPRKTLYSQGYAIGWDDCVTAIVNFNKFPVKLGHHRVTGNMDYD